jgi:ribose transport system substrate-binding protein
MFRRDRATVRHASGLLAAVASVVLLAACGSSGSTGSGGGASSSAAAAAPTTSAATSSAASTQAAASASGGCGTLPAGKVNDPTGAIASLGTSYASDYAGFSDYPVTKSAWANWKPAKKSGWNVQIVWTPLTNPFTNTTLAALKQRLKASGKVSTIQVQAPAAYTDVPQQLQEIGTAVQRKPDLLIVFALAPAPAVPLIAKAAAAGIPTVSPWTLTPSKYAVSLDLNPYLNEGQTAAGALKAMGGKGSVLEVHGIPGTSTDAEAAAAWKAALAQCPNVKVAGTVNGQFVGPVAKGLVQQFLATHPSGVQGVFHAGTMGVGVLGAFQQTGHTPPPMADPGTSQGVIAYWHSHPSYQATSTATPDPQIGAAAGSVALRMLEGQGPKVNTILAKPYVITSSNVSTVYKPSFAQNSLLDAYGPDGTFMPDSYLNGFFNHGATP